MEFQNINKIKNVMSNYIGMANQSNQCKRLKLMMAFGLND